MALVPITVMGFRCERCAHEWIPRGGVEDQPRVCPKCRSPWWDRPAKSKPMPYEEFRDRVAAALSDGAQHTWTEVRTAAGFPQLFPNNQWVRRMENDIGLHRHRGPDGVIHWQTITRDMTNESAPSQATSKLPPRSRAK